VRRFSPSPFVYGAFNDDIRYRNSAAKGSNPGGTPRRRRPARSACRAPGRLLLCRPPNRSPRASPPSLCRSAPYPRPSGEGGLAPGTPPTLDDTVRRCSYHGEHGNRRRADCHPAEAWIRRIRMPRVRPAHRSGHAPRPAALAWAMPFRPVRGSERRTDPFRSSVFSVCSVIGVALRRSTHNSPLTTHSSHSVVRRFSPSPFVYGAFNDDIRYRNSAAKGSNPGGTPCGRTCSQRQCW
jgi:hypothetical protein